MNDRALLEAAARAHGAPLAEWHSEDHGFLLPDGTPWNPLRDDGDALRLLATMGGPGELTVRVRPSAVELSAPNACGVTVRLVELVVAEIDRTEALRRLIVRFAAVTQTKEKS